MSRSEGEDEGEGEGAIKTTTWSARRSPFPFARTRIGPSTGGCHNTVLILRWWEVLGSQATGHGVDYILQYLVLLLLGPLKHLLPRLSLPLSHRPQRSETDFSPDLRDLGGFTARDFIEHYPSYHARLGHRGAGRQAYVRGYITSYTLPLRIPCK